VRKFIIAGAIATMLASPVAFAQSTSTPAAPGTTATAPTSTPSALTVSQADGKAWVGKRVHNAEGDDMGEISGIMVGSDGNVEYFKTDIGGFLGIGETHVRVKPGQFKMRDDKLFLDMTEEQAKALPKVPKS
jgi:hypothetical protein